MSKRYYLVRQKSMYDGYMDIKNERLFPNKEDALRHAEKRFDEEMQSPTYKGVDKSWLRIHKDENTLFCGLTYGNSWFEFDIQVIPCDDEEGSTHLSKVEDKQEK